MLLILHQREGFLNGIKNGFMQGLQLKTNEPHLIETFKRKEGNIYQDCFRKIWASDGGLD